jgi:TRAP-type C4-dicarboxylate transport system permease small subunit
MNGIRITGVVLIVASVLALAYGGFSYTKDTREAQLGPIELTVRENKTVNIPMWAGVLGIVIGGALLFYGKKKGG